MLDRTVKASLHLLSPAGTKARLQVFIFHRVLPCKDFLLPNEPDSVEFDSIVQNISRWFNVLPLGDAVRSLYSGQLPQRAAAITFDDGYEDNLSQALPILQRYQMPATFFIATGFMGGECMWNDLVIESIRRIKGAVSIDLTDVDLGCTFVDSKQGKRELVDLVLAATKYAGASGRKAIIEALVRECGARDELAAMSIMMSPTEIEKLANAGMEIGAHTVTHPILTRVSDDQARVEIARSRDQLRELTGQRVDLFAYPNGKYGQDYDVNHARIVKSLGFQAAVTTDVGVSTMRTDSFHIPRFTPWSSDKAAFWRQTARNYLSRSVNSG